MNDRERANELREATAVRNESYTVGYFTGGTEAERAELQSLLEKHSKPCQNCGWESTWDGEPGMCTDESDDDDEFFETIDGRTLENPVSWSPGERCPNCLASDGPVDLDGTFFCGACNITGERVE